VRPATRKGRLLVWILAVEERAVPRVELAELLWGRPRAPNLRQALHRLRRVPGSDRGLSVGVEVWIDVTSDLGVFRRHLDAGRPAAAVAAWRGARTPGEGSPVLPAPVDATGVPAVGDWLQLARAHFEDALGRAL
jgi:DNA-binding SARP family transcriptional activator